MPASLASCYITAIVYRLPMPNLGDCAELALRLAGRQGLVWLDAEGWESAESGRWSFIGCEPVDVVSAGPEDAAPLDRLDALGGGASARDGERWPRWIGYVSYDAAWAGRPRRLQTEPAPLLYFARYDALVAIDHPRGAAWIVGDDERACRALLAKLRAAPDSPGARAGQLRSEEPAVHAARIARALSHIGRGDIYQVNLARPFSAALEGAPLALWLHMRRASPVPLGMYLDAGDHALMGRSMECFLRWQGPGSTLVTRPIKGTLARSDDDAADARQLRADAKEQAEHTMIVDLMRNDLGRVAVTGTVRVERIMEVEPYRKLSHLVSTVTCRSRRDVGAAALLGATFPPGSVTGCPKLRAMQIIEELEDTARGAYTGTMGYFDSGGGAQLAVAIRTAVAAGERVRYFSGGGVVADSVVEREIAETELKARVFVDALQALGHEPPRHLVGGRHHALA